MPDQTGPVVDLTRRDEPPRVDRGGDDPDTKLDLFDPRIDHRVDVVDRGPFAVSVCTGCGWESFARRSRPLARSEGRDHELLFSRPWS